MNLLTSAQLRVLIRAWVRYLYGKRAATATWVPPENP